MMLKIILYAYMNNIYSCRKIERQVRRDIHYIWLAAQERPDLSKPQWLKSKRLRLILNYDTASRRVYI